MKTSLRISLVLTWFNLVVWGFICLFGLLLSLGSGNTYVIVSTFLLSAIVLHSYASLKLHRSIRHSKIPLSDQTPAGIRFVGFIALFFGIVCIGDGVALLQNPAESAKLMMTTMPEEYKSQYAHVDLHQLMRLIAVFFLIIGLCIAVNVVLNFRLLRWYYLVKQSDIS